MPKLSTATIDVHIIYMYLWSSFPLSVVFSNLTNEFQKLFPVPIRGHLPALSGKHKSQLSQATEAVQTAHVHTIPEISAERDGPDDLVNIEKQQLPELHAHSQPVDRNCCHSLWNCLTLPYGITIYLDRVFVNLHLPYGGEFFHGQLGPQELNNGLEFLSVLWLVQVTYRAIVTVLDL